MEKFLAFFGHINIDFKIRVTDVNLPGSQMAENVEEIFGGTAGNFAMVAAKLKVPFDLYSSVSSKTHQGYLNYLRSEGVDTSHIDTEDRVSGPVCYIITDGSNQRAFMHQGPIETWKAAYGFKGSNYKFINIGTGPVQEYMKIVDKTERKKIVFDPGQELSYRYDKETTRFMVKHSSMFIVNSDEFQILKKRLEDFGESPENILENFIVTKGSEGSELYSNNKITRIRNLEVSGIYDTVGAGDAFRAGLYFGLYHHYDLTDSVIFGNIVAAESVRRPITEFSMTPDQLKDCFEKNRESMLG
ncbi:carbohydrate kinase family protein [Oxyplasma meridianum]|uniref:Carbohydrate kinase family protein n=1 Tax=Oxyplasma meridianum TaxID=3073602 RepID=A0AAX4NEE6_9ARCH